MLLLTIGVKKYKQFLEFIILLERLETISPFPNTRIVNITLIHYVHKGDFFVFVFVFPKLDMGSYFPWPVNRDRPGDKYTFVLLFPGKATQNYNLHRWGMLICHVHMIHSNTLEHTVTLGPVSDSSR